MNILFARTLKLFFCALVCVLPTVSAVAGGIGFQGRLSDPPSLISSYQEPDYRFSVAMYPMSYDILSTELDRTPRVQYGRFSDSSVTFNTKYYRDESMVPVSVGASEYLSYRMGYRERRARQDAFEDALVQARQGNRRVGLSIGLDLPKRFDRMFGEGGANLRVEGYRKITFSGQSQWNDATETGPYRQSKFPSLRMEQISRFDITGTIGTKISVKVSQDNQTDIPLSNRIELRYRGDEDDILKSIEAGNTTLSLPNTRFVGYSSRIQGLFGVKAEAQLGRLNLTAIASQEKGSSESATISATGEENADYVRDYEYVEGRIYDLGRVLQENDIIQKIEVFEEQTSSRDDIDYDEAVLLVDPTSPEEYTLYKDSLRVDQLEDDRYELWYSRDPNMSPVAIVFTTQRRRKAIGVYMEVERNGSTVYIGGRTGEIDTLLMIRPIDSKYEPDHPTWDLMWRNCYSIPKDVKSEDIQVSVWKGAAGREGTSSSFDTQYGSGNSSEGTYLEILGLDQVNNSRPENRVPDDKLDDLEDVFRPGWGLLIFPHRRPFDSDTTFGEAGNPTNPLRVKVDNIYEYVSTDEKLKNSEYYLQIISKSRSNTISLGRANIIVHSERVLLNGELLERDRDYRIQYDFGQISLLTPEASDPNADLEITFEYAPFLAVQKKTLLGMRAEYDLSRDIQFGSTVLYKSDKAQDRKPRVGQETAEALVLDFDFSAQFHPKFMTTLANAIPLVRTESDSRFRIEGEVAKSYPNPNVDGVAYVDDFESAVEDLSLGLSRHNWQMSSEPVQVEESATSYSRGTMRWHSPPAVLRDEVFDGEYAAGEGTLIPLRLIFRPHGYRIECDSTGAVTDSTATASWGGIMRYFGGRVDASRVQLFEMRAKGGKGILHFDFGVISEDIDGDGRSDNEDLDTNDALSTDEDIGLDLVRDESEVPACGNPYGDDDPDPAHDNWWFEGNGKGGPGGSSMPPVPLAFWEGNLDFQDKVNDINHYLHYDWVNGTEGNYNDGGVQGLPDQEAISGGIFQEDDAYFSFEIPLDTVNNPFLVPVETPNPYGWVTYRIPIHDQSIVDVVETVEGSDTLTADWARIRYVRVWFEQPSTGLDSLNNIDSLLIAKWGFIQSNWQDSLVNTDPLDETTEFFVASVSEEDNSFTPPDGVEAYYDQSTNVEESQKGLALIYNDLDPGDTALAVKTLINAESYSGYRKMEMFVHGPEALGTDQLVYFMRLGRDSINYYEYFDTLGAGWSGNSIGIEFDDITALKDSIDKTLENNEELYGQKDRYRVRGRPNINEITQLSFGLVNVGPTRVSGVVWLDELRVSDVRKDEGTAGRLEISGSMADLLTYSVAYEKSDPYFRNISTATRGGSSNNLGSGEESTKFNYSLRLNFDKFMPKSWNARIPISVSGNKNEDIPLLRTNSDVVLPDNRREEEKSTTKSFKFSVSETFARRGKNVIFSGLLNRQSVSFSYSRSERSNPNNPLVLAENYSVKADYDMGVRTDASIPIFFWTKNLPLLKKLHGSRLSLLPYQWDWTATFNRSLQIKDDADYKRTPSFSRTLDGSMRSSFKIFPNLTSSFSFTTKRDLTDDSLISFKLSNPKLGRETSYGQSFQSSYDPKLFSFLTASFGYSASYSDNFDYSSRTLTTTMRRSWNVNGQFQHQVLLGGKSSGVRGRRGGSVRGGGARTAKGDGKHFYDPVLAGLRFLTSWLDPIRYKYGTDFNNSYPGALVRPAFFYRLGFQDQPTVKTIRSTRNPSSSEGVSYEAGSGFRLLGGLTTGVSFRETIDRDIVKIGNDRSESRSTSWPDLTLTISQFKFLPLLKKPVNWFIRVFAPRTGYSRSITEDRNIDRDFLTNRSETISQNPLLSVNFKLFRRLSLSASYAVTKSHDHRYNSTDGTLRSETKSERTTLNFTTKYSFTAPSGLNIPLFGKVKFKSTVNIDLDVKMNSNYSEVANSGGSFRVEADKSDFSVSPRVSYTFSQQIRGGLSGTWQDTKDNRYGRNTHTRRVDIWAEIRF